jgi:hypothetical protein
MNPCIFLMLGLFAIGATAQSPTVWDEREGEWVTLSEFSRRYASLGPGALRLSQVGPTAPAFTADLRLIPDAVRPSPPLRYIEVPRGPVVIRGRVYESPHTR